MGNIKITSTPFFELLMAAVFIFWGNYSLMAEINLRNQIELSRATTLGSESVAFNGSSYTVVPDEAWIQSTVWRFSLEHTLIQEISSQLGSLRCLKSIQLHNNPLRTLPDCFLQLPYLSEVLIHDCPLELLPESLLAAASLKTLVIADAHLVARELDFGKLSKLETLTISCKKIAESPASVLVPPRLTGLQLKNLGLENIPESLRFCTELAYLNLENNRITTLPKWLFLLPKLERIILKNNPVSAIELDANRQITLEELDLEGSALSEFPAALSPHVLRSLNLSNTRISRFPSSSTGLPRELRNLQLSRTGITEIPDWLAEISSLQQLNLYDTLVPAEAVQNWRNHQRTKKP